MSDIEDDEIERRPGHAPYNAHHPVPTIKRYKEVQQARKQQQEDGQNYLASNVNPTDEGLVDADDQDTAQDAAFGKDSRYDSENRNLAKAMLAANERSKSRKNSSSQPAQQVPTNPAQNGDCKTPESNGHSHASEDTSQVENTPKHPKDKRKQMQKSGPKGAREVTDPVTHLPVLIHDYTDKDLKKVPENVKQPRTDPNDTEQLKSDHKKISDGLEGVQKLFPPPSFHRVRSQINAAYASAFSVSSWVLAFWTSVVAIAATSSAPWRQESSMPRIALRGGIGLCGMVGLGATIWVTRRWLNRKIDRLWEDEVWEASKQQESEQQRTSEVPESAMWLNSVFSSIWPLVNPDLFTSVADQIEDVMQASLPKVVRMVAVKDIGQGNQAIRILGVRWLPPGAAGKSVGVDGAPHSDTNSPEEDGTKDEPNTESNEDDEESQEHPKNKKEGRKARQREEEKAAIASGLEGEAGDFINVEIAFSYRAPSQIFNLSKKADSAHLYLVFYLPGSIPIPVWASLTGLVGTLRARLQTSPDPPFLNMCTFTFLGQPKADITCTPLVKRGLNIMDLPLISAFVNSSISAALAEYVAPKSLTLDLKQMLTGDDFKKDTNACGVIFIRVKNAWDMKEGDISIPLIRDGSNDCYISAGWAKFSKPLWSTRVIQSDMHPHFDEHCALLVGHEELNAHERLRIQLWDSDRTSADDDLGRIEISLKELMSCPESRGKMWVREDGFVGLDGSSRMPGRLAWEVGYFEKLSLTDDQVARQSKDEDVKTVQALKKKTARETSNKLREASDRDVSREAKQEKTQNFAELQEDTIAESPPPDGYPSGILSIQIHNATGLEVAALRRNSNPQQGEHEDGEDLPSPYCTVIINNKEVYKTRTKPKNSKPFFNAATEKFIRDWKNTEIVIAIRDARVHEDDALLGIVYLPLEHVLEERAQVNEVFPLGGGVGYGRLRLSLVFRAVTLQLPKELLGWDFGTLEIQKVTGSTDLAEDLKKLRIRLMANVNKAKMFPAKDGATWKGRKGKPVSVAVRQRYASALAVEFRTSAMMGKTTSGFGVLWLKDVPDDETVTLTVPIFKGSKDDLRRAKSNCLDEIGSREGSLEIQLKFFAGLSDAHRKLKDPNISSVLECLDVAADNRDIRKEMGYAESSDSSGSDSDDEDTDGMTNVSSNDRSHTLHEDDADGHGGSSKERHEDDAQRNPIQQLKDYKDHHKELHRQNRGLMQWKATRTAKWMRGRLQDGVGNKVRGAFKHHDERQPDIETEV